MILRENTTNMDFTYAEKVLLKYKGTHKPCDS